VIAIDFDRMSIRHTIGCERGLDFGYQRGILRLLGWVLVVVHTLRCERSPCSE
jgi:hypothetical protein